MRHLSRPLLFLLLLLSVSASTFAVQRVAPSWGYFEFGGSYANPTGSYSRLTLIEFLDINDYPRELSAKDIFDPSGGFHLGFGQVRNGQVMMGIGYSFTKVNVEDEFLVETSDGIVTYVFEPVKPHFALHDVVFDLNFFPLSAGGVPMSVAPYVGLGLKAGLLAQTSDGYESEYDVSVGIALNFGLEIRMNPNNSNGYFALASINSWDIVGSNERPRFLKIGGGLRYYWK